jgi:3-methyladenine DNA glycosylase/8-oxoguanine DNA glycosylase
VRADLEVELPSKGVSLSRSATFLHMGLHDPTGFTDERGLAKAYVTSAGPATLHLVREGITVRARAWGPGAAEVISHVPGILGHFDDPEKFEPRTAGVARRFVAAAGLRLVRVPWVFDALVRIVLQQRVRFVEATRAYRGIVARHAPLAPGPLGLRTALTAEAWAAVPPHEAGRLGVDRKRFDTVRRLAGLERHVAKLLPLAHTARFDEARRVLDALPGVGPWTREKLLDEALGDADAVSTGDVHLPRLVCSALDPDRSARYDDARMLELLEPWRGQRARVVRLVVLGLGAPPAP